MNPHALPVPKAQNRTRSGEGRPVRPFRLQTEESLVDATMIDRPSALVASFVDERRCEARADADLVTQLFAAVGRFKTRLMSRVQYAKLEETTQPGVVKNTRIRLEDERAALSVVQAQAVVLLASSQRRVQQIEKLLAAVSTHTSDMHQLASLRAAVVCVTDNAQKLIDETRVTMQNYSEITGQLI
jgi:hypothetical protein